MIYHHDDNHVAPTKGASDLDAIKGIALAVAIGFALAVALVNGLASWIDANRKKVCDSSQCQSQIDLIVMLCNQTAYKLKFLA